MTRSGQHRGFTLAEMMVAVAVGGLVIAGVSFFQAHQKRMIYQQREIAGATQSARVAYDLIARDIRMAGYGVNFSSSTLDDWISWETGMDFNPQIDAGTGSNVTIRVAAAYGEPETQLVLTAPSNSVAIVVADASEFNTSDKGLIYLGRSETARITAIAGNVLTITTDRSSPAVGTQYAYAPGSTVELVKVITYDLVPAGNSYPNKSYVRRRVSGTTYDQDWHAMLVGDVETLSAVRTDNRIDLTITAKTTNEDLYWSNGTDGYRRITLDGVVAPRN